MPDLELAAALQPFTVGSTIVLGKKTFTVLKLRDTTRPGSTHTLEGGRGARYMLQAYLPRRGQKPSGLYYVAAYSGPGGPVRAKNGLPLQAYIYGDLLSDATTA